MTDEPKAPGQSVDQLFVELASDGKARRSAVADDDHPVKFTGSAFFNEFGSAACLRRDQLSYLGDGVPRFFSAACRRRLDIRKPRGW